MDKKSKPKKLRLRLTTATEIKRSLSRIANMVVNDEIDTKKANSIVGICNAVLNSIRTDEQQAKINELSEIFGLIEKQGKGED